MENPAHVYTTGIPMSEKGNFTHNKYGCDEVETLEDVPLQKIDDKDYPDNSDINLFDSTPQDVEYINSFQNGCDDDDSLKEVPLGRLVDHNYPNSSNVILCDSTTKNGGFINCIQDDFQQSEILCGFVCDAGDTNDLGIQNSLEVQSIQDSDAHIKFPDSPGSAFTCKIEPFSNIEGLDQGLDEQIDHYLLSSDFQKVNKPQLEVSGNSLEEEQRTVTEAISAIAKSFGLEDLLPDNFQVDEIKGLPVTHDSLCGNQQQQINDISLADFEKCSTLESVASIHLPSITPEFELSSLELLTTQDQDQCNTLVNDKQLNLLKDGDSFFVNVKQSYDSDSLLPSEQVVTDLNFEENDAIAKEESKTVEMQLGYETVTNLTTQVNDICEVSEDLACDVPTVRIEDVQVNDPLEIEQNGSSTGTVTFKRDKVSKKMQIVLTLDKSQQIYDIDTESIDPNEQPIDLGLQEEQTDDVEDVIDVDQSEELVEYSAEFESEKSNDFFEDEASYLIDGSSSFVQLINNVPVIVNREKKGKTWVCPIEGCGQILDKECKLKVHMISHKTSSRPFKCEFEGCDWAFTTPYRLRRHAETHLGSKDFVCDFEGCNRKFTTVYNLKTHSKRHKWPNSLTCPSKDCKMSFANRRKLELHLRVHKDVEAPYKCGLCSKQYYSANCIASHYRTHQYNADDFKCPFQGCGKIYDKICRLRQHIRHHTGDRPYTCPAEGCKWSFMSASKLTRHMRKHTGERKFMCTEPGCGKSFMRPEHLKGHVVIHSGDKPFHCPHENCNAKFTAKSSLYVHVKKHCPSVLKVVYPCPVAACLKKYNSKATLKQHLQKFHPDAVGDGKELNIAEKLELTMPVSLVNQSVESNSSRYFEFEDSIADDPVNDLNLQLFQAADSFQEVTSTFNLGSSSGPVTVSAVELSTKNTTTKTTKKNSTNRRSENKNSSKVKISDKLFRENHSGCARTDYSCKNGSVFMESERTNLLLHDQCSSDTSDVRNYLSNSHSKAELKSPDIMLASTIIFNDNCSEQMIKTNFLQDECSTSHSLYHDDSILVSSSAFETELIPVSLLSDDESDESALNHSGLDFSEQNSVDTFAESIRLHGLD